MKDRIYLSAESDIPIYLQIVHQLTYLIYSQQLAENEQLPTMRALADHLRVNPNTVAQAYAELQATGLIDSQRGRGSFVRPQPLLRDADWSQRHDLLDENLRAMREKARALGFNDAEIQQHMQGLIHSVEQPCEVLYVGHTELTSQRYATTLTQEFAPLGVRVSPITIDEVEASAAALNLSYFVITYVSLKQRVEDLLRQRNRPYRVLGISLELTEDTTRRIASIPPGQQLCVFSQERYQAIALNVLQSHSTVAHANVRKLTEESASPQEILLAAEEATLVVHTLGVRPRLDELGIEVAKRLELGFRASHESLVRLSEMFANRLGSESQPAAL